MEEIITYKCPNCTSNLLFNPDSQNWNCQYCGSNYDEKRLQELCEISQKEFIDDVNCYYCGGCGANIIINQHVISTTCAYCGSNLILNKELRNTLKPEKIIPFKINKKKAEKIFYKYFGERNNFIDIEGMYLPYWLYSFSSDIYIENFNYDYKYIARFSNILVDGSDNINNNLAYAVRPFDYKGLRNFSHTYLSGFYSERFIDKTYEPYEKVSKRVIEDIPHILYEVYGKIVSKNNYKIVNKMYKNQYVLLPVWIINCEDHGKKYNCYINGQTGKCVSELEPLNQEDSEERFRNISGAKSTSLIIMTILYIILIALILSAFIISIYLGIICVICIIYMITPSVKNWKFVQRSKLGYDDFNKGDKKKRIKTNGYIVDVGRAKK